MEMNCKKGKDDWIAHKILDTLLEHNLLVLRQSMLFMSDKAVDELVENIQSWAEQMKSVRMKSEEKESENERCQTKSNTQGP